MVDAPKKWIWFRGLVRWKVHWGDFEREFLKARPQDSIQMIDFPGFGDFHSLPAPSSMDEMLSHIDSKVEGSGPFYVLAFSLGGMVATHWAARHPQKVQKLFLINTSDNRSLFYERFHPRNWWLLLSRLAHPTAENVESGILQAISNVPEKRQRYLKRFIEAYGATPFSRANMIRQLKLASQTRFPAQAPVPAVILTSDGDRLVNSQCSKRLAAVWRVPLQIHPWAGHDITLDDPHWVLQKLQEGTEGFQTGVSKEN